MNHKTIIGLFGFGCVGQGLFNVLLNSSGYKAEIKKIVVKNRVKKRSVDPQLFSYDKFDILNDKDINTIVELIDDSEEAFIIVSEALKKGKAVVTANKKMLAKYLEVLKQLQQEFDGKLLYEAAVCGSIPIIRNLEEYFDNEPIISIRGIFNGTTNYILTKIIQEGLSYAAALKNAQDLGFTESDPKNDVEGFDPTFKNCILAAHAFGVFIKPEYILRQGIQNLQAVDLQFAKQNNYSIKLQAQLNLSVKNELYVTVLPQLLAKNDALSNINNEFNSVLIEGAFSGIQQLIGKGAGGNPTGAAVLSDLSALSSNYKYQFHKANQNLDIKFSNEASIQIYLRLNTDVGDSKNCEWINIDAYYSDKNTNYTIGEMRLVDIATVLNDFPKNCFISLLPESTFKPINKEDKTNESELKIEAAYL